MDRHNALTRMNAIQMHWLDTSGRTLKAERNVHRNRHITGGRGRWLSFDRRVVMGCYRLWIRRAS